MRSIFPLICFLFLFVVIAGDIGIAQEKAKSDSTQEQSTEKNDDAGEKQEEKKSSEKESIDKKDSSASSVKDADKDKQEEKKEDEKKTQQEAPKKEKEKEKEGKEKEKPKVSVRLMPLSGSYVDKVQPLSIDPVSLAMGIAPKKQKSFYRLCDYLASVEADDDVKHAVFDLSAGSLGMNSAQLDEITRRLRKLKSSGKKTIAWLENASTVHLSLAAACDEVMMTDFGGVDFPSAAMEAMYFRDAMDLIGVQASVVRAGDFKGAVEPYTNPAMSKHLRKHYIDMLQTINDARVSRIAKGRGLTTAKVRELQKQRFLTPKEALAAGLVDKLVSYGEMKKTIDEMIGEPTEWTTPSAKKRRELSMFDIMNLVMNGPKSSRTRLRDDTIAVLHLSGTIVDGKSNSPGSVVSGPTVRLIESILSEDKIKGVVVRINSPGGSATASEAIRQALKRLAKKKPTVISMGRLAASGGYWVSCIGVPIYAEHGTITGSIGVFSMKLSFGPLMRRVGVNLESITLDESASAFSIDRAWSDSDATTIKKSVDLVYDRFLKLVGDSRKIDRDDLEEIAGGRVWSGTQAKSLKLIDEIGGLDDCLAVVSKKAKLEKFETIHRPVASSSIGLLELLGDSGDDAILENASESTLSILAKRGLSLSTTKTLLKDGVSRTHGQPTIWLLTPAEFCVR